MLTLKDPIISESCIEIKIELSFYFDTSLWCLKRFYEGIKVFFSIVSSLISFSALFADARISLDIACVTCSLYTNKIKSLFLYPLKFSDVFSEYRKRPVA